MNLLARNIALWRRIRRREPVLWINTDLAAHDPRNDPHDRAVLEAESRLSRSAALMRRLFPELGVANYNLSPLVAAPFAGDANPRLAGRLFVKCDHALPLAGSIKARGGFHEVLAFAERLAISHGLLRPGEDLLRLAEPAARAVFAQYTLSVGSTGNLGLGIGVIASALGFRAVVHMSNDAKAWKKQRLRDRGVRVVEHPGDYAQAVEQGRRDAAQDPFAHFVDDERSLDLFVGYAAAARQLAEQLRAEGIEIGPHRPLFVYVPCGVGGAPGGIAYGLKRLFGQDAHLFFGEPVASPCMLVQMLSGLEQAVSVYDVGLDNRTEADGLAVAQASMLVAPLMQQRLSGVFTARDDQLFALVRHAHERAGLDIEPSAAMAFAGPLALVTSAAGRDYLKAHALGANMAAAVHVAWTTGGSLVPEAERQRFLSSGAEQTPQLVWT